MVDKIIETIKKCIEHGEIEVLILLFFIFIMLFIFNKISKETINKLIIETIKESEKYLNSKKGQERIIYIKDVLQNKISNKPLYLRLILKEFVTEYYIVTFIEKTLNFIQDKIDKNAEDIDIIGNEIIKKKE